MSKDFPVFVFAAVWTILFSTIPNKSVASEIKIGDCGVVGKVAICCYCPLFWHKNEDRFQILRVFQQPHCPH